MASWCETPLQHVSATELASEAARYLDAVDTFRSEGCEPVYTSEGEWMPEPTLTFPDSWERRRSVCEAKSFLPSEEDGA